MSIGISQLTKRLSGIRNQHKAEQKHPQWPTDPIHATAILGEECGEVVKASIDYYFNAGHHDTLLGELDKELMQVGAMAIRTSLNIDNYSDIENKI